jgi:cell division protein FtsB
MLFGLAVLACLYISPVRGLFSDLHQTALRHQQVLALEHRAAQLSAEERALSQPSTIEREARNLGLVRPGERLYAISGLPDN